MYTLTPLNYSNRKPILPGKKPQASSVAPDSRQKSATGAKNTPLFGGRGDAPYPSDVYKSLGLEKLSIARHIEDKIEDDLSDVEYYEQKAKREQEIAKQRQRDYKQLERDARHSFFNRRTYRTAALAKKESMLFHQQEARAAVADSKVAKQEAREKEREKQDLREEGQNLLDYADRLRPRFSSPSDNRHTRQGNAYSRHSGSAGVNEPDFVPYRRGAFNPMPDTIFEEPEPIFVPPPKPRSRSFSQKKRFAPPPKPGRSHSYSEKSRHVPPPPDNLSDYYASMQPEAQTGPYESYDKPSFNPFSQHKSYTVPGAYPEHSPFTEHPHPQQVPFTAFQSHHPTPEAPPYHFDFGGGQYPSGAGPSHSPHYGYNNVPKTSTRANTCPIYPPKPADPPLQEKYRHPNENNFKYEKWMPNSWRLFTANVPTAIQDIYETKELGQLFKTAVRGIVNPVDTKKVEVEENGEKKYKNRLKTSKEVFRDWKVKTHPDKKASEEDAMISSALCVLFDEGPRAIFEFDSKGQAIKIRY